MAQVDFNLSWRGEQRIYLSLAPGAGAARRMIADAHIAASQGYAVALAIPDLGRLEPVAFGLPELPMRSAIIDGEIVDTIDIDAIRDNPPALVVMGNLADFIGMGARHSYRARELEALLRLGCAVSTNLYAYEIEPLVPIYRRLTHLEPPRAVPSTVLEQSDVVFVDPDISDIIRNLELGEIMPEERMALARRTLYRKEVLATLRRATLALLEFRGPGSIGLPSAAKVMVCVGYRPNSGYLIERARQIADGLGADLLAVHVRPPTGGSSGYEVTLQQNLALAEDLGAQTMVPKGRDVAATLLHVTKTYGVTSVVIGRPERNRWNEILRGSLLTQLLNANRTLDVYVIGDPPKEML